MARMYMKDGRYYGDFRSMGKGREALIHVAAGEKLATTDKVTADELYDARKAEIKLENRGIATGHGEAVLLGAYAQHHLERKDADREVEDRTLSAIQRHLERAVAFWGADKPLTAIKVTDVKKWAQHLRTAHRGREGNPAMGGGQIRHHLNSLSNLYRRACEEEKIPEQTNPVASWSRGKPRGNPGEANHLEVHEAALLLEACRAWRPNEKYAGVGDLYAIVATALLSGGRPAEVLGLAVDDVSFQRQTITFRPHSWRRLKTDGSRRTIRLWPQLAEILKAYLAGPHAPTGKLLFPSRHRRVSGMSERMLTDVRGALDAAAEAAGWTPRSINMYDFRHSYTAARLQTLDRGEPIAKYTVAAELGHGSEKMVDQVYGHIGTLRHRSEVVEFRPSVLKQIDDVAVRRQFKERLAAVRHGLKIA